MEPECAVAFPEDDGIHIISGDQGIYQTQRECSDALGLPLDKVRVSAAMVGGGFGGKEDMSVQHHAALLAQKTNRPVKVNLQEQKAYWFTLRDMLWKWILQLPAMKTVILRQ